MSGHSKWNNIKRKKEKTDGARAKVFTKIGREISVAVRDGGPNPASNSKLADLIAKAKRMSVPNDNIQRIIKPICLDNLPDIFVSRHRQKPGQNERIPSKGWQPKTALFVEVPRSPNSLHRKLKRKDVCIIVRGECCCCYARLLRGAPSWYVFAWCALTRQTIVRLVESTVLWSCWRMSRYEKGKGA